MSGRTDWKEIFGKPEQGFVNRVHATLDGLTEAGTSRCTPQHFRRRRLLTLTAVLVLLAGAALAAAEYGVLDVLLGIHEQPQRREGLEPLHPVDREEARQIIGVVDKARAKCLKTYGEAFFYAADECYLKAGWPLPG